MNMIRSRRLQPQKGSLEKNAVKKWHAQKFILLLMPYFLDVFIVKKKNNNNNKTKQKKTPK